MSETLPLIDMNSRPTLAGILAAPVMISIRSRFDSDGWYIDGRTPGYTKSHFLISWDVAADQKLIDGLKYLAALLFLERDGRKVLGHGSASTFSVGARHLLRFMNRHGYTSFAQFDAEAVKHFERNLHVILSDPDLVEDDVSQSDEPIGKEAVHDGDLDVEAEANEVVVHDQASPAENVAEELTAEGSAAVNHGPMTKSGKQRRKRAPVKERREDEFTFTAALTRMAILSRLWEFRDELEAAGVASLPEDPFPGSNASTRAEAVSKAATQLIPPLPDEVAIAIMSDAYRLIQEPADDVIELQRQYLDATCRYDRTPWPDERTRLRAVIEGFEFTQVGFKRWRPAIRLDDPTTFGGHELRKLIDLIRCACVTVIFSGTGCRISEVLSLETGQRAAALPEEDAVQPGDLPDCVSTRRSKSGLHRHFLMHGKLSKDQEEPVDQTWLCGSCPTDRTDVEPPVVRAIKVLERLYAPWRALVEDEHTRTRLVVTFNSHGLPRKGSTILPATAAQVNLALTSYFSRDEIGLADLTPAARADPKLAPYARHRGRNIRSHQWRKTFALNMMRLDERMLPALANHFKHLSIAVTEGHYMPQDPSMIAASESVHMMETQRALYEMRRGSGGSLGKLDLAMDAFKDDLERLIGDLPLSEHHEEVRHKLVEADLRIFHAEHGRCLIAANPDRARCHEAAGTSSWRRLSPNYETRTPGLCAGCENFSISAEHAGFWLRRYLDNQSAWLNSSRSADFEVVRRRAEQAAGILKALGQEVPTMTRASAERHIGLNRQASAAALLESAIANDDGGKDASSAAA